MSVEKPFASALRSGLASRAGRLFVFLACVLMGCIGGGGGVAGPDGGGNGPALNGWVLQHPSPTPAPLFAVDFPTTGIGYAVGETGAVLKTTDGGRTWTHQFAATHQRLESVHFVDANTGFAVGTGGEGIRTADGGKTWTVFTCPTALNDIAVLDASTAVAVGIQGEIYKTEDGGAEWFPLPSGVDGTLHGVLFVTSDLGFAVGADGVLLRTQDGGDTWQERASGTTNNLLDLDFTDATTGFVVGAGGTILKTTNAGSGWIRQESWGMTSSFTLSSISFSGANEGFVRGYDPFGNEDAVFRTSDGGESWNPLAWSDTSQVLYVSAVAALGGGRVVGVGYDLLGSDDGLTLESWTTSVTTSSLNAVFFVDQALGFAVGSDLAILKTTNGGASWRKIPVSGVTSAQYPQLNSVYFTSASTGYAVGYPGLILKTVDGGETWSAQASGQSFNMGPVVFQNADVGLVFAEDTVLRTTNGGATWTPQTLNIDYVSAATRTASGTIFAVGGTTVLKSSDGGATWSSTTLSSPGMGTDFGPSLQTVSFGTEMTGYASAESFGGLKLLFKTTDGGENWVEVNTDWSWVPWWSMAFANATTGYGVGFGTISKTTDGGLTWKEQVSGFGASLSGVTVAPGGAVYLVGQSGAILRSE